MKKAIEKIVCDHCGAEINTKIHNNVVVNSYSNTDSNIENDGDFCPECHRNILEKIDILFNTVQEGEDVTFESALKDIQSRVSRFSKKFKGIRIFLDNDPR